MKTNLRTVRENRGKTQVEVAKAAGITLMSYYRYESGERLPRVDVAIKIAETLNSTVDELFG